MPPFEFTHLDPLGRARMVDVTAKEPTHRRAVARCRVHMEPETASMIASGAITKGDVLAVARVAGIQAAKQTPNLMPLCHPLLVGAVLRELPHRGQLVEVEAQVDTVDRTGVEMEALTACAVRGAHDLRHVQVGRPGHDDRRSSQLWEKTGGRSGHLASEGGGGRGHLRPLDRSPAAGDRGHSGNKRNSVNASTDRSGRGVTVPAGRKTAAGGRCRWC